MSRYEDRARRVAEEFWPLSPKAGDRENWAGLTDAIVKVIREFVEHDLEWAAVALEELINELASLSFGDPVRRPALLTELRRLAESFRARGRQE